MPLHPAPEGHGAGCYAGLKCRALSSLRTVFCHHSHLATALAWVSRPTPELLYVDSCRLFAGRLLHLLQDFVQVEGGRLLPLRVLPERRQELADESLSRHEHERVIEDQI